MSGLLALLLVLGLAYGARGCQGHSERHRYHGLGHRTTVASAVPLRSERVVYPATSPLPPFADADPLLETRDAHR